jgi:hypothetical protein
MSLTHIAQNEYGTDVAAGICDSCKKPYTICPAPDKADWVNWADCLSEECPSYNLDRDIDLFFEPMVEHGLIQRVGAKP